MKRRQLILTVLALAAVPLRALAQASAPVRRIGILMIDAGSDSFVVATFRDALRQRGHTDGSTVQLDLGSLVERFDQIGEAAERLVKQKVDIIVCYGATATLAASKATSAIPIVMVSGTDPVKLGVGATLSRPGRNVTGVTFLHPEIDGKRLELLREVAPGIRRVGIVLNPEAATEGLNFPRWEAAAGKLTLDVERVEIRVQADIDKVIPEIAQRKLNALAVVGGTMFIANRRPLVGAITKARVPAIYGSSDFPEVGGLISYGPNVSDGFRQAANLVDKILKGAKPADIPFEQATKFELAVNLQAARQIGISIPRSVLLRADKVVE